MKIGDTLVLISSFEFAVTQVALSYIDQGFTLKYAYSTRKYKFFGEKTYYIELLPGREYYEELLEVSIAKQDYEAAAKIRDKINKL
jgi:hypothetical protein